MTPADERKALVCLLKQIDHGASCLFQKAWVEMLMWTAVAGLFLAIFQAGDKIHPLVLALISLVVGVAYGAAGFCKASAAQWPVVRPHMDRESIVARLSQLEP